jgi:L-cysteine/cystine lyase
VVSPFLPDPDKVAAIRALLPATGAGIYLNAGMVGPMPAESQRAMDERAARELAVGRANVHEIPEVLERLAEARAAVAAVLVGDPDDVALTHSTTDGLAVALGALPWQPGDRLVTTTQEHPGILGTAYALRDRLSVDLAYAEVGDGGDADAVVAAVERALGERHGAARAVAVSHVLWTTGAVLPIARIAAAARAAGAAVIVDGAQSAGAIPVAVEDLGVDAYAVPAQKWLLGPEGMGALWASRAFATSVVPPSGSYFSFATFDPPERWPNARRFEVTSYHRPSVVGFARSCGWLTMYVGLPWALERAGRLARTVADRLAGIPGVTLLTPRDAMATLVTFRIAGWRSEAAVDELGARAFAITRALPMDAVRISVGFWNTDEELERFASVVELLAAHEPGTIPPRRTLPILGAE